MVEAARGHHFQGRHEAQAVCDPGRREAPEQFGGRRVSPLLKLTASQSFNRITKECVDYTNAFGLNSPRVASLARGFSLRAV